MYTETGNGEILIIFDSWFLQKKIFNEPKGVTEMPILKFCALSLKNKQRSWLTLFINTHIKAQIASKKNYMRCMSKAEQYV